MALVEERDGHTAPQAVKAVPKSKNELHVAVKAGKVKLSEDQARLNHATEEEKLEMSETGSERYKRTKWDIAERMKVAVKMTGVCKSTMVDVRLADSWEMAKGVACEKLDVGPKNYNVFYCNHHPPVKVVRKHIPRPRGW